MKYKNLFLILIFILSSLVLVISPLSFEKAPIDSADQWISYMDQHIPVLMKRHGVPGLILAVIHDGELSKISSYGYADKENGIPMTVDTPCRMESISKSVTAWGVMKLVSDYDLDIDAPVATYLNSWEFPDSPYDENKVTVRNLLDQSSGMPLGPIGVLYDPKEPTPALRECLTEAAVLFKDPGTSFYYSNLNYNILELLIEEVSGISFSQYMRENILEPLSMDHSSYDWDENWDPQVPNSYDAAGKAIPVYIYPDKGSGGLFSTAEDIASFVLEGMDPVILDSQTVENIYKEHVKMSGYYGAIYDGYGFGHFIEETKDGKKIVSHGGQGSGWMSHFYSIYDEGEAIVMIANSQRAWPLFSEILTDWSRLTGFQPVGMSLIRKAAILVRIVIVVIIEILAVAVTVIAKKRRQLSLKGERWTASRILSLAGGIILAGSLIYIGNMDYFFLDSVLPSEIPILKGVLAVSAAVLVFIAVFPEKRTRKG
ncbi:MAG: serine hydrolase domain-containing protein [Sphaerochaetaceae bacterium]